MSRKQETKLTIEITKGGYKKKLAYDGKVFCEEWKCDKNNCSWLMNDCIADQLISCGYPNSIVNVIDRTYARFTPAEIMNGMQ